MSEIDLSQISDITLIDEINRRENGLCVWTTQAREEVMRIIDALAGRDPAKLDALLTLVMQWIIGPPEDSSREQVFQWNYGMYHKIVDAFREYDAAALSGFEDAGRDVPVPPGQTPCTWRNTDEYWESACGLAWWLVDGTPVENNMHYCPKCGGKIEIQETLK